MKLDFFVLRYCQINQLKVKCEYFFYDQLYDQFFFREDLKSITIFNIVRSNDEESLKFLTLVNLISIL